MKKIFAMMMTVMMIAVMATANAGGLMENLDFDDYHWVSEDFIFENPEDNYTNVVKDSVYIYGDNMTLSNVYDGLNDNEIEEKLTNEAINEGFINPAVFVKTIKNGKVTVVYIYAENNLNELLKENGIINEEVDQEIHNCNVLCWRDYASME